MEKTTCTLIVRDSSNTGILSIQNGDLKNAECAGEHGLDAAMRILSWKNITIEMEENYHPEHETLSLSIEEILLESFRRQDEENNEPSIEYEDLPALELQVEERSSSNKENLNIYTKEERMNVQKLNNSIETLKENLGGALLATDIWASADMQSIAGWNSNPAATALFGQIITSTNKALKESGFPILGKVLPF